MSTTVLPEMRRINLYLYQNVGRQTFRAILFVYAAMDVTAAGLYPASSSLSLSLLSIRELN